MKKKANRLLSIVIILAVMVGFLQTAAFAESTQAKDIGSAYGQVLNSASTSAYGVKKQVVFYNTCGDEIPEMIVASHTAHGGYKAQIWTYQNGASKKLLELDWPVASAAEYYLYMLEDGKIGEHYTNEGANPPDNIHKYRNGSFYRLGSEGIYLESSSFSYDYYVDFYSDIQIEYIGGEINGKSARESEVKEEERKLLSGALIFDTLDDIDGAMTLQEAKAYLNSIKGRFWDVSSGQYYTEAVEWAVNSGITSGTDEVSFSPDNTCTRAQAVTFLWRAAGSPQVSGGTGFSDVATNAYYTDAVKWAVKNGITSGVGNGKFDPNGTCSRAQIVTFMYRAAGLPVVTGNNSFNDVSDNAYYSNAVRWAVKNGITSGTSSGKFSPDNPCTRGQIVTFLYRWKTGSSAQATRTFTDSELCEMSKEHYEAKHGRIPPIARVDSTDGNLVTIQLYEISGNHTVTWDWYIVDRTTLQGESMFSGKIDLLNY